MSNYIPEQPDIYQGKQVIINSDRLIFNAKEDSILLYSDKAMGFSTNGNFHFDTTDKDTNKFIVNSPNIYLGLKNQRSGTLPTKHAVVSENLELVLDQILKHLELFTIDVAYLTPYIITPHGTPAGFNPANDTIVDLNWRSIEEIRKNLSSIRSKNTKLV